jgi:drug/metabolite transporter (DMT)-like permease
MTTRDAPRGGVATPRMRRQLWVLAVLAGFVVVVVAIAFVAAFRNTDASDLPTVTTSSTATVTSTRR